MNNRNSKTTPRRLRRVKAIPRESDYAWASERWLRRQIYEGGLASYRVGGYVLVDLDDLDELVQAGRRSS